MVGKQWISEMRNMRSEYYRKDFSGEDGCDRIEAEKKRKERGFHAYRCRDHADH